MLEDYCLTDIVLTNKTKIVNVYNLNYSSSQSYEFTILNYANEPIQEAYIKAERYYPDSNTYSIIEMAKTDSFGKGLLHLVLEDVFYRYIIEKDGSILYKYIPDAMYCSEEPCEKEIITSEDIDSLYSQLNDVSSFRYNVSYDYTSNMLRMDYTDTSGTLSYVRMVARKGGYASDGGELCNVNATAASGVLLCNMSSYEGTFWVDGYISRSPEQGLKNFIGLTYTNFSEAFDKYGSNGILLGIFLIITLVLIGLTTGNPKVIIIMTIIGLASTFFLGFDKIPFKAIMGIVAIGVLIIMMLMRGNRYE